MTALRNFRKHYFAYLLILPTALFLVAFQIYPLAESIRLSFTDMHLVRPQWRYIGIDNFVYLLTQDERFWLILKNSLIWIFGSLIGQIVVAFAIAMLLNRSMVGRALWRGLSMVPWMMPVVVVGLAWRFLFDYNYGLVNHYLKSLGWIAESINWLGSANWIWFSLILAATWKGFGYLTIMILAGLKNISQEIYEAAAIDGANAVQQFWRVTIPQLKPVLFVAIVVQIITGWTKFEMIWVLTNGGPGYATSILPTYIYTNSFDYYKMGLGSAVAVVSTLVVAIFLLVYIRLFKQDEQA